jgi:hypothetical protein
MIESKSGKAENATVVEIKELCTAFKWEKNIKTL